MLPGDYDYELCRTDELKSGDFIWYLGGPRRVFDVTTNEQTTSFTVISGSGIYGSTGFTRPNSEPQTRILNLGVLF